MATAKYDPIVANRPGYLRGTKLANLAQRWGAGAIDYIPLLIILTIFQKIPVLGWFFVIAALLANNVILQGLTGQSLGKKVLHITTFVSKIDEQGDYWMAFPGVTRCLMRQCFLFVDFIVFYTGFLRPGWERRRRCWSDSLSATFVAAANPQYLDLRIIDGQVERLLWQSSPRSLSIVVSCEGSWEAGG